MNGKTFSLLGSVDNPFSFKRPALGMNPKLSGFSIKSVPPSKIELRPSLKKGERGGVIGMAATISRRNDEDGLGITQRRNDEGVIKVALLFVDHIDKPRNMIIGLPEDSASDITGIGLGGQSTVFYSEGLTYTQASSYIWKAYEALNDREPGIWSIWQQYENHVVPESLLTPDLAFQIELKDSLIVPDASNSFEDVIRFKESHRDELISLRHHLEDFAIKLSKEGDPRAINLERERFDLSLSEYLRKARKSNIRKAVASLTAELDWAAAVRSFAGGGGAGLVAAAQSLSLTAAAAAIGGGAIAGLSIKSVAGLKEGPSPFRYIARLEREYGS